MAGRDFVRCMCVSSIHLSVFVLNVTPIDRFLRCFFTKSLCY